MRRFAALLLALLLLAGCQEPGRGTIRVEGSRRQPLAVGEPAVYEGLRTKTEYGSFRLELELLDAVRGRAAEQIYLADGDTNRDTDIPEDKELLIVKMAVTLLESEDDAPLSLGVWAEDMFLLVAERGQTYDPAEHSRLRTGRFGSLEPGERQEGHIAFVVHRWETAPTVVFLPEVNSGLWFDVNVTEQQRGEGRIDPALWGLDDGIFESGSSPENHPDALDSSYGGTLANPLPLGEWGSYRVEWGDGAMELELKLLDIYRQDAEEYLWMDVPDAADKELLTVYLQANLLQDDTGAGVDLDDLHFYVRYASGRAYERVADPQSFTDTGMSTMFSGSTQEGSVYFVVDKGEDVLLSPNFSDEVGLWFTTDPDVELPEGLQRFESRYTPELASTRDATARPGSLTNPLPPGESGLYRHPGDSGTGYEIAMQVQRVFRGDAAERIYDPPFLLLEENELLCVQVEITLLGSDDDGPVVLSPEDFQLVSSLRVAERPAHEDIGVPDPVGRFFVGETVEANLVFIVSADDPAPLLCVPAHAPHLAPPIWFELAAYGAVQAI